MSAYRPHFYTAFPWIFGTVPSFLIEYHNQEELDNIFLEVSAQGHGTAGSIIFCGIIKSMYGSERDDKSAVSEWQFCLTYIRRPRQNCSVPFRDLDGCEDLQFFQNDRRNRF